MKKLPAVLIFSALLVSCFDPINIDLPKSQPLLVVDGAIFHDVNGGPATQRIKLTTTKQFYGQINSMLAFPEVKDAIVSVSDGQNKRYFYYIENGVYEAENFVSEEGKTYTLSIRYKGQLFQASETLPFSVPIEKAYHKFYQGHDNLTGYAIKLDFTDPADVDNFYLWELLINNSPALEHQGDLNNEFLALRKDDSFSGLTFKGLRVPGRLAQTGDEIEVKQYAITSEFYQYYFAFFSMVGSGSLGLVDHPIPANLQGNVRNLHDPDKDALGYFRVGAMSSKKFDIWP